MARAWGVEEVMLAAEEGSRRAYDHAGIVLARRERGHHAVVVPVLRHHPGHPAEQPAICGERVSRQSAGAIEAQRACPYPVVSSHMKSLSAMQATTQRTRADPTSDSPGRPFESGE